MGINTKTYTHNGKEYTIHQAVKEFGIDEITLRQRLRSGMSFDDAAEITLNANTRAINRNKGRKSKIYTYEGKEYTLDQASKEFGIAKTTLDQRLRAGLIFEDAIEITIRGKETYIYNGKEYTLDQASKEFGITRTTLIQRLRSGMSFECVVETPVRKQNKIYNYRGKEYTLSQAAKEFNIDYGVLYGRLRSGWTFEDAINTSRGIEHAIEKPVRNRNKYYTYNGKEYSIAQAVKEFNIGINTLYRRLTKGMSFEDAIKSPIQGKGNTHDYKGKKYTIAQVAREFGISHSTLDKRMDTGMSLADAIDTPIQEQDKTYNYEGKKYTIAQASREFGISYNALYLRLYKGVSFEDAVNGKKSLRVNGGKKSPKVASGKKSPKVASGKKSLKVASGKLRNNTKKYNYDDEVYTISRAVKEFGINENTLRNRLARGVTFEDAIEKEFQDNKICNNRGKVHTTPQAVKGVTSEYAIKKTKEVGIKARIKSKANKYDFREYAERTITYMYKGEKYTIERASIEFGISYGVLRDRLRSGMSFECAVRSIVENKVYNYKGRDYTCDQASKEFGISKITLQKRLRDGWVFADAVETPIQGDSEIYNYKGRDYTSREACKEFAIRYNTLQAKLKAGLSFEEAVEFCRKSQTKVV